MKKIKVLTCMILFLFLLNISSCGSKKDGTIDLYVTGHDNVVLFDDEVAFYKGEVLLDVLNRHLDIEMGSGSFDGMIIGINNYSTDIYNYYYRIVVNCEFASFGADQLSLNDSDEIRITYAKTSDWSTGC